MLSKNTILLIEDDKALLELYSMSLKRAGFEVLSALDGQDGLEMAQEEKPDLILLDILLPKVDGYSILEKLRSNPETENFSVIIFSNLSQKEEIEKGYRLGADDYVVKTSMTPKEMVKKVKEFLKKPKP